MAFRVIAIISSRRSLYSFAMAEALSNNSGNEVGLFTVIVMNDY